MRSVAWIILSTRKRRSIPETFPNTLDKPDILNKPMQSSYHLKPSFKNGAKCNPLTTAPIELNIIETLVSPTSKIHMPLQK